MSNNLEVKDFGYGHYKADFKELVIATRLPEKTKAIRFLLTHKNYFLQDIGDVFNILFVVEVDGVESNDIKISILNNLDWIMESSGYKIKELGKDFLSSNFIQGVYSTYVERKKEIGDKLSEQELYYLAGVKWVKDLGTNERQMKQLTSIWMPFAQSILPAIISGISKSLLGVYNNQKAVIGDDYNECVHTWRKCNLIEPLFSMSVCPNELCKHFEFIISSNPKLQKNCTKCGSDWINITLYKVKEPFSSLKLEGKDFSVFLSNYIKANLSLPAETVPECYVSRENKEHQIDIYLKKPPTIFQCKVHENRKVISPEKAVSICLGAVSEQLIPNLQNLGVKNGYLITNLYLDEKTLSKLGEKIKEKIKENKLNAKIIAIAGDSDEKFLEKISSELKEIDKQLNDFHELYLPEFPEHQVIKLSNKTNPFESVCEKIVTNAKKGLGSRLRSLILYGSAAKGTLKEDSDIDIFAVVSDEDAKEELFDISFEIGFKHDVLISMITRTKEELEEMEEIGSIYLKEVKETGRVLYGEGIG